MKFTCEKALLTSAISLAARTVAQKSTIPCLEGIFVRAGVSLQLTGFNLETGITVRVGAQVLEAGSCVMPARLFFDIVRKLPDEEVCVSVDDELHVSIRGGASSFQITAMDPDDYPDLPEVDSEKAVSLPQHVLREMIGGTIFSVSENQARPVHTGCLMEVKDDCINMVAVDSFRLARRTYFSDEPFGQELKFVVPASGLKEVEKILEDSDEPVRFTLGAKHILFEIGDATLVCRILEGEFLDYKNAIPRRNPINLVLDTKTMLQSLERVSVVISEKLKSPVRCLFEDNKVTMSAKTASGDAKDVCRIAGDGQGLEIGFNNRYLMDALRYAPADTVKMELNTGISPAIIVPVDGEENFLYMVLPVRLKAN